MKNSLEVELKKKLVTVKSPYDIGSILYDYSKKINMKEYIKILEDIIKTFDILKNNVGVYDFKGLKDEQKFYIEDDDLVIYFDLYDIAPYALGIPKFKINISTIQDIVKDEYMGIFKR